MVTASKLHRLIVEEHGGKGPRKRQMVLQ